MSWSLWIGPKERELPEKWNLLKSFLRKKNLLSKEKFQMHCKFLILIMRKNTQNEHIIAHFEYFFTCHYSKTVWLAESLNEIKNYLLWENLFSYQAKIFSFWERVGNKKTFFCLTEITIITPRYITLKLNQTVISKISNYLT